MRADVRLLVLLALGGAVAACDATKGGDARVPTAPAAAEAPAVSERQPVLEASQGLAPAGFRLVSHVDPRPGEDGVIRAESSVTVEVDMCQSMVEADRHAWFLFDFNFDHKAEVVGTSEACRQTRTYHVADTPAGRTIGANFCLANGNPRVPGAATYFSCRSFRVAVPGLRPGPEGAPAGCYTFAEIDSFFWPGGTGPFGPIDIHENTACEGAPSTVETTYVAARTEEEAAELCRTAEVQALPALFHGGTFFDCDPKK